MTRERAYMAASKRLRQQHVPDGAALERPGHQLAPIEIETEVEPWNFSDAGDELVMNVS